jgi:hypothetical protein
VRALRYAQLQAHLRGAAAPLRPPLHPVALLSHRQIVAAVRIEEC